MPGPLPWSTLVKKSDLWTDPFDAYRAYPGKGRVLLESARVGGATGRYSIVVRDPFLSLEYRAGRTRLRAGGRVKVSKENPLSLLKKLLTQYRAAGVPGQPPFTGGAVGYFGYEAKSVFEPALRSRPKAPGCVPDIYFLFFHDGVLFDHLEKKTFFFTHFKTCDTKKDREHASKTLDRMERDLRRSAAGVVRSRGGEPDIRDIRVSMDRAAFGEKVLAAQRYITSGDIYQANLSHLLSFPVRQSAEQIYDSLRRVNPSPFFGLLDAGDFQLISGSPERLLRLEGRDLETRPIAGTRPRRKGAADAAASVELMLNEKERAEHLMLLDLERNDLGRVAEYGSVTVDELMTVEDYSHVKHIVSNVRAVLRKGLGPVDALAAFFPGGTITGAPKIRCMEIIDELETVPRGPYTGSLGYISFTGNMDFNIIIRSLVIRRGWAQLNVGAGIVADSDPDREYDETLHKAEAVLKAVFGKDGARRFLRSCGAGARMSR